MTHLPDAPTADNAAGRSRRADAERTAALGEAAAPHLLRAAGPDWLARLDADAVGLDAALELGAALDPTDEADNPLVRIAAALWPYWWLRGSPADGWRWLAAALERTSEPSQRLPLLAGAGVLAFDAGDIRTARVCWSELLGIGKAVNNPTAETLGLAGLSLVAHRLADPQRADALGRSSLVRSDAGADAWARVMAQLVRGRVLLGRDNAQAAALFADADQAASAAGLTGLRGYALIGGAFAALGRSDGLAASTLADEARTAFVAQSDARGLDMLARFQKAAADATPR